MAAFLRRHLVMLSVLGVLAVGAAVFVAVWFQPQKLIIDDIVNDPLPPAASGAVESPTATSAAAVLAKSSFRDRAHHARGTVRVVRLADGSRILRLEGLDVENGPDLYVTLAAAAADAPNDAFDSGYVSLGRLKGNKGDQTYEIASSVDLSRYASVVIWCKRFSVAFGTAPLTA